MDPLAEIRVTFFQECEEQLAELESGLLAMEGGETDGETINAVFRAVHSIKGGAGAFGLEDLVRFAHVFETALDEMRSGRLAPEPETLKVLLRAADVLADLVRAGRDGSQVDEAQVQSLGDALRGICAGEGGEEADDGDYQDFDFQPLAAVEPVAPGAPSAWRIRFKPRGDLYARGNEACLLLRELTRLGPCEVELDASELPGLADLDPEGAYLAWTVLLTADADVGKIAEVFEFVDGDCELEITPADGAGAPEAEPDPDMDVTALLARLEADAPTIVAAPPEPEPAAAGPGLTSSLGG